MNKSIVGLVVIAWMFGTHALAGDVAKGEALAKTKCAMCHDLTNGKKNKLGPYLWDIMGQPAGKVSGFKYSAALMEKAASITWDEATMSKYVEGPKDFIPGGKMLFPGLKDAAGRDDVISFLKTLK